MSVCEGRYTVCSLSHRHLSALRAIEELLKVCLQCLNNAGPACGLGPREKESHLVKERDQSRNLARVERARFVTGENPA